ncbi:MAG: hypothetical protein R3C15_20420 [Thermoleophilia bacterium]
MRQVAARRAATVAVAAAVASLTTGAALAHDGGVARVTNANDAGPGSLRAAIERASADPSIRRIELRPRLAPIALAQPVAFTGAQSLAIDGNGATIDGGALDPAAEHAILVSGGGDLTVTWLTVRDAPQQGLTYEVPAAATGVKRVVLHGVEVLGNGGHGVLVDDQVDPEDTGNQDGSPASLDVRVVGSRFADNGFGALDRDGLRIDEGGVGTLRATISLSRFEHNGADGVELDERGLGDAVFRVSGTQISRNGSFDVTEADLDDGMDVDEWGEGALIGTVLASSASDNFEEGWDFNENEAGDFRVDMALVEASRNREEGVDFEEDDDVQGGGDLVTTLVGLRTEGNGPGGDAGLKIRERGDGLLRATVRGARADGNLTGGVNLREQGAGDLAASLSRVVSTGNGTAGIALREDDAGSLSGTIDRSTADGNVGDGIDLDENADGDLTVTASRGSASGNVVGVRADQGGTGVGALQLVAMALVGNTTAPTVANPGVTVTETP